MNIIPQSNLINLLSSDPARVVDRVTQPDPGALSAQPFSSVFRDALGTVTETDTISRIHNLELLSGQSDDLATLMIDIQRSELSLNLAIQIRNRLVEAYQELMRMQV